MKKILAVLVVCFLLAGSACAAPSIGGLTEPLPAAVTVNGAAEPVSATVAMADETNYTGAMAETIHLASEGAALTEIVEAFLGTEVPAEVADCVAVTGIMDVQTETKVILDADDQVSVSVTGSAATQGLTIDTLFVLLFHADQTVELVRLTAYDPVTGDFAFPFSGELCPFTLVMTPAK